LVLLEPSVTSGWENFFVAEVGASAALAGLLFVAVSINLARILEFPQLPGRVAEALTVLLSVLAVATCGLVPGQGARLFGAEVAAVGLAVCVFTSIQQRAGRKVRHPQDRPAWRVATGQVPMIPYVVGGALLAFGVRGGIYWLVPGTLLSFFGGVANAWVLLIEIQR
jgi:hypothetical protein